MIALPDPPLPAWLRLRPLALSDLDAVLTIETAVLPTPWSQAGYTRELTENHLARYLALDKLDAAGQARALLGFAGYWLLVDELHISMVAVAPACQRRGLGELLLIALLWQAPAEAALATLEVRAHNHPAQQLYHKLGFTLVGRRKQYYRDTGEDALLLTVAPLDDAYRARLAQLWAQRVAAWRPAVAEQTEFPVCTF